MLNFNIAIWKGITVIWIVYGWFHFLSNGAI